MARKYFGTDGIRGRVNQPPMTPAMAMALGIAAGQYFRNQDQKPTVVIGRDTRNSGPMLQDALSAGFKAAGLQVIDAGVVPTPAVAVMTVRLKASLGVMISASHNPYQDNGIKLFGPDGFKLNDEIETQIEASLDEALQGDATLVEPEQLGMARDDRTAREHYILAAMNSVASGFDLSGMKVVLDCANGAAYELAPTILRDLGAEVTLIGAEPNGLNINLDCGSTHTEAMQQAVKNTGADVGIALDGDADRVLIADETGALIDGDQLMAVVTRHMHENGLLKGGGLVATVMSNMGLEDFLSGYGLSLARTKVGDRYVVEHMRANGFNIGGEQSGHIVLMDHATTGDGLIAALQILSVLKTRGQPASAVLNCFTPFPQLLKNVRFKNPVTLEEDVIKDAVASAETEMNGAGRVVLRKSGTEPLVRVMVEAKNEAVVDQMVDRIVAAVEQVSEG